jgi:hypothetical protein
MNHLRNENLERGFSEIWRREKVLIASLCFLAIFAMLACIPAGMIWGGYSHIIILIIPISLFIKIWFWVEKTPCPKCGHPYGGIRPQKKCINCKIEIKIPEPKDYSISFKEIKYQPLEKLEP